MCMSQKLQIITGAVVEQALELLDDKIEKIFLYGSYARGDFNMESDVDIMLLLKCDEEEVKRYRMDVSRIASRVGLANDLEVSIMMKSGGFFDEWLDVLPFYQNVQKEGVILYGE